MMINQTSKDMLTIRSVNIL